MKIKAGLVAAALSASTAGVLFGGGAVHTALTSDSADTIGYHGASVAGDVKYGPHIDFHNLQPGESHQVVMAFENTGSVAEEAYWVPNGFTVTDGHPNIDDISITYLKGGFPANLPVRSGDSPVALGQIPAGQKITMLINFGLKQSTGNSWNNAGGSLNYTVHFQDTNGTDGNGFVATANN